MLIAHISDTHIATDRAHREVDFVQIVNSINLLQPQPDLVVHTGDVVHNGRIEEYVTARAILNQLRAPFCVLPGNKDNRSALRQVFGDVLDLSCQPPFIQYAINSFPVRLLCLDTLDIQSNKGEYCRERFDQLINFLAGSPDKNVAIFLHHPPFEVVEIPDPMQFGDQNSVKQLRELLSASGNVRHLFSGHVHRTTTTCFGEIPACTVTSVALDLRKGAYRQDLQGVPIFLLHRYVEGDFETREMPAGPASCVAVEI